VAHTYKVEGLPFDTYDQAWVVAKRIYLRYDRTRDIEIIEVDDFHEFCCDVIEAEKEPELGDTDTLPLF